MKQSIGLLFAAFVAAAVGFAFSARSGPPLPATEIKIDNALLLDAKSAGSRQVAVGERGYIFVSENQGRSWQLVPSGVDATLTGLAFADEHLGLAVGHDATILRTEDGGTSWKKVFSAPDQQRPLLDVVFDTPEHAIAVGAYAAFFESHDAGKTWQERRIVEGDKHFNALARLADGALLIAGEAGTLLRSDDAGVTWKPQASPYAGSFFGIQPLASGEVLIYGMRGVVLRGGADSQAWEKLNNQGTESLLGSVAGNALNVTVLGQNGLILSSSDGGVSFRRLIAQGRPTLTAGVALPDPDAMLVFGDAGVLRLDMKAGVAR